MSYSPYPPKPSLLRPQDDEVIPGTEIWEVIHTGDITLNDEDFGIALWCNLPSAKDALPTDVRDMILNTVTVAMPELYEALGDALWVDAFRVGGPSGYVCRLVKLNPADIGYHTIQ